MLVAPGTNTANLDFLGKNIIVESEEGPECTVVDDSEPVAPGRGSVVLFQNHETRDANVMEQGQYRVARSRLSINDEERECILAYPPSTIAFHDIEIPDGTRRHIGIGMPPKPRFNPGDGVQFCIKIKTAGNEAVETILDRRLDPFHHKDQARWFDFRIDLSAYGNTRCDLFFETEPCSDPDNDFAVWIVPYIKSY